jgi:murein DD-endopeptidase MepM/ murein hydrolase activator NlpD
MNTQRLIGYGLTKWSYADTVAKILWHNFDTIRGKLLKIQRIYQPLLAKHGTTHTTQWQRGILNQPVVAMLRARLDAMILSNWVVDLGHEIGSKTWWRGMATLGFLLSLSVALLNANPLQPIFEEAAQAPAIEVVDALAITPLSQGARTGTQVPMSPLARVLDEAPERPRLTFTYEVAGQSIEGLLRRSGVNAQDIRAAMRALAQVSSAKSPRSKSNFEVVLGRRAHKGAPRPLEFVRVRTAFDQQVELERNDNAIIARAIAIPVIEQPIRVSGTVGSSLFVSARNAGVPSRAIANFIEALSFSVDFQRDVLSKDRFDLVFERRVAQTGEVETGDLLYATLDLGKRDKPIELIRFAPPGEKPQFFHADGMSVRRLLLKTPVDGARVSSGFGWRTHPIMGYSRLHKGIDFAAPTGTPIMAAGDGVVEFIGWRGGYGNYIRIRHSNRYQTAYAHMSRFHPRVRSGTRVSQGQTIGYVGSTGFSTGPHLHYEIHVNGAAVNPNDAKLPIGRQLAGAQLVAFERQVTQMRVLRPMTAGEIAATLPRFEAGLPLADGGR